MAIKKDIMDFFQKHLGYTDGERVLFEENPRNEMVLSRAVELMNKTIIAEIVESKGCNSRHKVGDKIYFDGAGNLLSKMSPARICIFALQPLAAQIFGLHELFYAGIDNPKTAFNGCGCFDVGVQCGGWGHICMEVRMENRKS